jgi:hypothetical protein
MHSESDFSIASVQKQVLYFHFTLPYIITRLTRTVFQYKYKYSIHHQVHIVQLTTAKKQTIHKHIICFCLHRDIHVAGTHVLNFLL